MEIKKVLAPTDLSELSLSGLRYALEAVDEDGELIVYHVIGPSEEWLARHEEIRSMEDILENRRKILADFAKITLGTPRSVTIRTEVDLGVPYEKIVDKAAAEKADLIIMSTHGWGGLLHMLLGSVTEKVVNKAACPVLSIHPNEELVAPANGSKGGSHAVTRIAS
jgi:nucleotide-binding universal stress UspA family protein